jgi:hypothetical protein
MTCVWILNVAGLVLNTIAAGLMYYFPPRVQQFTEKGEAFLTFVSNPKEQKASVGKRQARLTKVGPGLLALGFGLQLVSAFLSV